MTVRLTLRLPESLHQRLVDESRRSKRSLNELIVERLQRRSANMPRDDLGTALDRRRQTLIREMSTPWNEEDDATTSEFLDAESDDVLLSHEQLRAGLPVLPPSACLSKDLVDARADRE